MYASVPAQFLKTAPDKRKARKRHQRHNCPKQYRLLCKLRVLPNIDQADCSHCCPDYAEPQRIHVKSLHSPIIDAIIDRIFCSFHDAPQNARWAMSGHPTLSILPLWKRQLSAVRTTRSCRRNFIWDGVGGSSVDLLDTLKSTFFCRSGYCSLHPDVGNKKSV